MYTRINFTRFKANSLVVGTSFNESNFIITKIEYFAGLKSHINQINQRKKWNYLWKNDEYRKIKISPSNKSNRIIQTLNNLNL